jgi:putative oxidoreductase
MQKILALRDLGLRLTKKFDWLAPLIARLTLGVVFIESGYGKLIHLDSVTDYFTQLGIPYPAFQAPLVGAMEFVCGTFIAFGIFTRLASIPIVIMMSVAILTARKDDYHLFSDLLGFTEYLYIVLAVWLIIAGPGSSSVDHFLGGQGKKRLTRD